MARLRLVLLGFVFWNAPGWIGVDAGAHQLDADLLSGLNVRACGLGRKRMSQRSADRATRGWKRVETWGHPLPPLHKIGEPRASGASVPAGAQSNFAEVGPLTQVDVSEGSAPDLATEAVLVPHAKLETAGHLGPALNLDRRFATAIAARDPEELVLLVAYRPGRESAEDLFARQVPAVGGCDAQTTRPILPTVWWGLLDDS